MASQRQQQSPASNNSEPGTPKGTELRITPSMEPSTRIFVNRSLRLDKIRYFGFDLDYTLIVYKSPQYETLLFDRIVTRLVKTGYPEKLLKSLHYDAAFPTRGLWFDMKHGNFLKVDPFGNIIMGCHGTHMLKQVDIEEFYPNKFLKLTESRIVVLNTMFNLPDMCCLAQIIDYYDSLAGFTKTLDKTGVESGETNMTYKSLAHDVFRAVDWVHKEGDVHDFVADHINDYVVKTPEARKLLTQLRRGKVKVFLLTNSPYNYTNRLLTHLLGKDWLDLFDVAIVWARKPRWFSETRVFREIDRETGNIKVGGHNGPLQKGHIYAGGSCDALKKLLKMRGKDVLYIGDHVFGDAHKSKKNRGWRTFLVIPELQHEMTVWTDGHSLFEQLTQLDKQLAKLYKNCSNVSGAMDKIHDSVNSMKKVTNLMDMAYGSFGSLFRSGTRTTFFASQVERYADIYSHSCFNLLHYPQFYFFRSEKMLLPHESTVDHFAKIQQNVKISSSRTVSPNKTCAKFFDEETDDVGSG